MALRGVQSVVVARIPDAIRRPSIVIAALIMAFAVGHVAGALFAPLLRPFYLDLEYNLPAFFSAALLAVSAVACWRARSTLTAPPGGAVTGGAVTGLTLLFGLMAFDEVIGVHERLEDLTGIDWQVLYAPLIAAGGLGWFLIAAFLMRNRAVAAIRLWVGGAFAWAAAQTLEMLQWDGDVERSGYTIMMPAEEVLEMAGSAAFLLTLLLILDTRPARAKTAD